MLLTEAALIREAYLVCHSSTLGDIELMMKRLKESEVSEKGDRLNGAEVGQGERYH